MTSRVLYLIACAAPPAHDVAKLVELAHQAGWQVCVLTTLAGRHFVDVAAMEELTGYPVRSEYKAPGAPDVLPPPDAVIVAPATVNTINKWAAGICDNLALGIIVEAIGLGLPVVAMPYSNRAHAAHPAFTENIGKLRAWGVSVLWGPEVYPAHEPRVGGRPDLFPWHLTMRALQSGETRQARRPKAAGPPSSLPRPVMFHNLCITSCSNGAVQVSCER